ncbi:MAG TPA: CCA tRNA nucleotidyltransferase [Gammaproteobacteria bacterium]|nr:CCA tRNA nucleotidyltransferase [Gammaproteobacteria bacterium]
MALKDTPDSELVAAFARAVAAAGGRALEAGGAVRDRLLGRPARDTDLEVYGLDAAALEAVVGRFGPVRRVGARLGVYVLKGMEIALPQAPGGVEDPRLSPEAASRRRDLTVNALLRDPLTGDILDFHGGRADLAAGRLRLVDAATFAEDPLRVLRVVRLHAELAFAVDPATAAVCRGLDPTAAAWERVGGEVERWLLAAPHPGKGLDALVYTGAERRFPHLARLLDCPAPGADDAWALTRAALEEAAAERCGERGRDWPLMLAALLAAAGRPDVTRRVAGGLRAPAHAAAAAARVPLFLHGVDRSADRKRTVAALVRAQEAVAGLAAAGAELPAYRRLARCVDSDLLLRLSRALHRAEHGGEAAFPAGERARTIWEREDLLGKAPEPILQGRDLAQLGIEPGPGMGEWLEAAFEAQLDGAFSDREGGLAWLRQRLPTG